MTANQINYGKFQEEVRHNLVTEQQDAPVKLALAKQYQTSAELNLAKVGTEKLNQDILNIQKAYQPELYSSQIASNYANANAQNAAAYMYGTSAALNLAKAQTEQYVTQQAQSSAELAAIKVGVEKKQASAAISQAQLTNEALNSDFGGFIYQATAVLGLHDILNSMSSTYANVAK